MNHSYTHGVNNNAIGTGLIAFIGGMVAWAIFGPKIKDRLNQILAEHTGQPIARIEEDTDRDHFLTSEEAVAYGLADKVIT